MSTYTVVRSFDKLPESLKGELDEDYFVYDCGAVLLRGDEIIFADGRMEPEDATLGRDLGIFVRELNRVSSELQAAQDELARIKSIMPIDLTVDLMKAYRKSAKRFGFAAADAPLEIDLNDPEAIMMMEICDTVLNRIQNNVKVE